MLGCLGGLGIASGVGAQSKTFTNSVGMEFVLIPAGEFMMGTKLLFQPKNETPRHKVIISEAFYMGKYEVTQEQWYKVMGNNPAHFKSERIGMSSQNHPVEKVSWDNAQEFIRKLNAKEGTNAYRLPTEAEWEYAARAGSETVYYFGDDADRLGEYAWYLGNAERKTHPAGQLKPNAWGLYDMHGNVLEWCQDWYGEDYYSHSPSKDPQGPASGSRRVVRGGDWGSIAWHCRSAFRTAWRPGLRFHILGFRLVRTPS